MQNILKAVVTVAVLCVAVSAKAQPKAQVNPVSLELFGMKLKGATRDQLRQALQIGGLQPIRVDDRYWVDTYNPTSVLDGASAFSAGYTYKNNIFAYAEYTFDGFMDTTLVTKVANMVSNKYGRAVSHSGSDALGDVTYQWNFPQGMSIRVVRGWPDTTTYLTFLDQTTYAQMQAEQKNNQQSIEKAQANAQSRAF
jgi:hypothetical protein